MPKRPNWELALHACIAASSLLLVTVLAAFGQSPAPRFEVASIKLDRSGIPRHNVRLLPGGLHTENASVRLLMQIAYGLQEFQVVGGPRWIDSDGYNIEAKAEGSPGKSQIRLMLQSLFEDRFNLKTHRETKELPSYTLIPTKAGAKLPSPKDGACRDYVASPLSPQNPQDARPALRLPPCGHPVTLVYASGAVVQGGDMPMAEFVKTLSELLGKPIVDGTGVLENFDVHLEFYPDEDTVEIHTPRRTANPDGPADPPAKPSIMIALQQQLGLKLESTKGPVEILVVDRLERPTGN